MSNTSQAGARDRGHQVGCAAMRLSEAACTCPRPAGAEYVDGFDSSKPVPWWIWVAVYITVSLAVLFIFWIVGVFPGAWVQP